MKIRSLLLILVLGLTTFLAACNFEGGVEQGRCVAFNPEAKSITIVVDVTHDQFNPHYSGGAHTYKLPAAPGEMGPVPAVGGRLMIDLAKNTVLIYDRDAKAVREIPVQFVDVEKNIQPKHPKVAGKTFPVVDKEQQTVTVYSSRLSALITFKVPASEIDLPIYAWTAGNEMRIAFRTSDKDQAIRIMNVSKTNIFSK
ncbi:MAG: DUF4881 domain-containing protein [Desulfovibrio sp. MES5]|uniref:DUF4881 domain-containing protein n=1 Tax=Desulfovibrio sp. MES5 TaxID=1899016 RepID=UPI000B9D2E97|nr:DUF4881 domain-containing protein [Desulfovibrio sp. MES5]OXS28293.1 MAG: DUF4881 domain-containing protein [Desulfovibrio sp. MES5]